MYFVSGLHASRTVEFPNRYKLSEVQHGDRLTREQVKELLAVTTALPEASYGRVKRKMGVVERMTGRTPTLSLQPLSQVCVADYYFA
jgi:hypothetical protein